jgi:hypothetical protein
VALIRTDVSEDRIASIFQGARVRAGYRAKFKLLYRQRLVGTSVLIRATRCHLPEDDNHQPHIQSRYCLDISAHLSLSLYGFTALWTLAAFSVS